MIKKSRVTKEDVGHYRKQDTGTMGPVVRKSDKMKSATRVTSGGVSQANVNGMPKSARMKGTRVTHSGGAGKGM